MGKFCECFSCCCFSLSSQPENAGPSHSTSPSSSQQPAYAGPSHSTSQQPHNAGPSSTTTAFDLDSFLQKFNDISKLHDLIKLIEDLLKNASGEKGEEGCSSQVTSYIEDGQRFLEFADKHIGKLPQEIKSIDGLSEEAQEVLTNLLKGAGKIHWVAAALSMVGFVLGKIDQMSRNKTECVEILRCMVTLGNQLMELNEEMPEQREKFKEAVACIVEGCSICTSLLSNTKIFRFLTSSVNAATFNDFRKKIDGLYNILLLWLTIDTHKIVPKIAPHSQELFARPGAVGIKSAQDKVIKLLDLSAQHPLARVVVVHGFGGIGKTTLADVVYACVDLQNYNHCRIHMEQNCTKNDIKVLQEQILNQLFSKNMKLNDCDQGRGMIQSLSTQNHNQPLFLYIDNGLKSTDLQELLPADSGDWLPLKSRILLTTRNLHEMDLFVSRNVQCHAYAVIPLPDIEGREILLKKVPDYTDESYINRLLQLCGGVPLLLELAGSQLAINSRSRKNIVLEMLRQGEKVEDKDISDRMVDFVYGRLLPTFQEAFLDITTCLSEPSEYVMLIVGEEEFRGLEEASFIKTDEYGMKLKKVRVIYIIEERLEQPPIEINEFHLDCMSDSLRILRYYKEEASVIKWKGKCRKPFKKLRMLILPKDISELPMEFEKLEHLIDYDGPLTEEMSLYELPPTLHSMTVTNIISGEKGVAYSRIPPNLTPPCSLVRLTFWEIEGMERLPNGVEKLTMLEKLHISDCPKLKELPSKIGDLSNLKEIRLILCPALEEWPSSLGDISKLKLLELGGCSSKLRESVPPHLKKIVL